MCDEHEALDETSDADTKCDGIEGQLKGEGNLSCSVKIHPHFKEIPPKQGKQTDAETASQHMENISYPFGKPHNKEIDEHMALEKSGQRDGKADDDGSGKGDQFIGADDRSAKRPQDDVGDREKHDKGDGDACDDVEEPAHSLYLADEPFHEEPLPEGE